MESNFIKASRIKLRFDTPQGQVTVEDLWNLPLSSKTGKANLDQIAVELDALLNKGNRVSFIEAVNTGNDLAKLKFDIVMHVLNDKVETNRKAALATANKERKQQLMEILARKQNSALEDTPVEDLMKMINEIE